MWDMGDGDGPCQVVRFSRLVVGMADVWVDNRMGEHRAGALVRWELRGPPPTNSAPFPNPIHQQPNGAQQMIEQAERRRESQQLPVAHELISDEVTKVGQLVGQAFP